MQCFYFYRFFSQMINDMVTTTPSHIADVSIFLLVRNTKSYLCQSFVVHYKALGEERQVYTEVRFQGIPHGSTDAPQKLHLYSEWEFLNWKFDYSMMGDQ